MLGEMIGEERGQITGQRVLPSEGGGPRVEASFSGQGQILGVNSSNMGTFVSVIGPDGVVRGEGQGVLMGEGGEAATWTGNGVGRFTGVGQAVNYRGVLYFQSASEKLAGLNGNAVVFEFDVDENGGIHTKLWEWK